MPIKVKRVIRLSDLDPDLEVDVEVLDVTEAEARTLPLSIDPLAALAETQEQIHERLRSLTPTAAPELEALCQSAPADPPALPGPPEVPAIVPQYFVLVECRDEPQQIELLTHFQAEGLECRALLS